MNSLDVIFGQLNELKNVEARVNAATMVPYKNTVLWHVWNFTKKDKWHVINEWEIFRRRLGRPFLLELY
ncbi:MAG: hypothetical protein U1F55_09670 [Chitinivorax sp.]